MGFELLGSELLDSEFSSRGRLLTKKSSAIIMTQ
jgi:hypothetical protein